MNTEPKADEGDREIKNILDSTLNEHLEIEHSVPIDADIRVIANKINAMYRRKIKELDTLYRKKHYQEAMMCGLRIRV